MHKPMWCTAANLVTPIEVDMSFPEFTWCFFDWQEYVLEGRNFFDGHALHLEKYIDIARWYSFNRGILCIQTRRNAKGYDMQA